jgi:diguanylate cyclase (GGDEF)-like protein
VLLKSIDFIFIKGGRLQEVLFMKPQILRKSLFITLFLICFFLWLNNTGTNRLLSNQGNNIFSIAAYLVTLLWMVDSFWSIKDKQRNFWLFFALGITFLCISKIVSLFHQPDFGRIQGTQTEDFIRLVGYLFFFTGFVYQIKVVKNTLPMLRFLFNIVIVIITVYSVSWYFIVSPILQSNHEMTHTGFFLSSVYHVLNICLLFAAACLIYIYKTDENKKSLYLIAAGFFIQVASDFFYINHVHVGDWIFLFWPMSALLLGLGAAFAKEYHWNLKEEEEKLEYKNDFLTIISAGTLLVFTYFHQENNVLEKGLYLIVILLLVQQILAAMENKNIFAKLKRLAYSDGNLHKSLEGSNKQNNEMARLIRKIEKLAHYDSLTELPNRHLFQKCMEQELKTAEQNKTPLALMYIDLDRFKNVNDSLGHECGDILLTKAARRIREAVEDTATVARIGGDEFAIILRESNPANLERISNQILAKFEPSFSIHEHELYTTPSIGITIFPEGGSNMNDLLKSADAAMYLAKEEGKNKFAFFNNRLNKIISNKIQMESRMRKGLAENHFSVYYQPQVDLRTEEIIGFEALVRWMDPELGMVSPVEFIPIAEETGMIEQLGVWVLDTACRQLKRWQQSGLPNITMSVNVSIRQFQNNNFVREVKKVITQTDINPEFLKLEITESILQNNKKTKGILDELRKLGVQFAIDDFGTGYSSLSYLKNLPVNCLKIDKAFIDDLSINEDGPIVKTIIDMGRNMNFTVIAEGIESVEHVSFLRKNKCFVGQGYLFSKPLPPAELEPFLFEKYTRIS